MQCLADLHKTYTVILTLLVKSSILHRTAACSWLPSFFVQQVGISTRLSLWMLLTCMVRLHSQAKEREQKDVQSLRLRGSCM